MVALGFVTIIATLYFFATPRLRARLEDKFQMGARSNFYLVESITGISTVKSLAIEGSMQRLWEDFLAKYVKSSFELSNLSNILSGIANALSKLMTLAILYLGVGLVIENKLSVGQLIAFQMFAGQVVRPDGTRALRSHPGSKGQDWGVHGWYQKRLSEKQKMAFQTTFV